MTRIDVGTDHVYGEVADGVGTITLNRPERRNAFSDPMLAGLAELLSKFEADSSVGAVVITGAGKAFCAGGDVKEFNEQGGEGAGRTELDPILVEKQRREQRETVGRIYGMAKPVLASLPGAAAGAGMGFALAADLRIGGTSALMATAFGSVGLSGDFGVAWLLEKQVGPALAREYLFLGGRIDAERCLALGLLNWVVADDELAAKTREIALQLANGPRLALSGMKETLLGAVGESLAESMDAEIPRHKLNGMTEDHRGAVAAFAEKRTPTFGGRS